MATKGWEITWTCDETEARAFALVGWEPYAVTRCNWIYDGKNEYETTWHFRKQK